MGEGSGLENRSAVKSTVGSNSTPSSIHIISGDVLALSHRITFLTAGCFALPLIDSNASAARGDEHRSCKAD